MSIDIQERMAKLEEKVENIKENLDSVVHHKLPHLEKKIDHLSTYIYIGLGIAICFQIIVEFFK